MTASRDSIRFNVRGDFVALLGTAALRLPDRNALYHTGMRMAYERWNRVFNFLVLLLGASAMADAFGRIGIHQVYIEAKASEATPCREGRHSRPGVAVIGALQLVFDFGRSARDHQTLQRDYYRLLAEIEACPTDDEDRRARWWGQMIAIAGDEPPVLRARDAKAYNDALDSLDIHDQGERLVIPWYQRLLGSLVSYEATLSPFFARRRCACLRATLSPYLARRNVVCLQGHHYRKRSELPGTEA